MANDAAFDYSIDLNSVYRLLKFAELYDDKGITYTIYKDPFNSKSDLSYNVSIQTLTESSMSFCHMDGDEFNSGYVALRELSMLTGVPTRMAEGSRYAIDTATGCINCHLSRMNVALKGI